MVFLTRKFGKSSINTSVMVQLQQFAVREFPPDQVIKKMSKVQKVECLSHTLSFKDL